MVYQIAGESESTQHNRQEKQHQQYVEQAQAAWEQAWDILHQVEGWHTQSDQDVHKGCVYSRKFDKLGKVFRLEAYIDAPVKEVFDVLVPGVNEWPKWNPTILECKSIVTLNENTDISYSVGAPQVGGLVSSRDFVNLRHWKSRDGILMSSACAAVHPDIPPCKQHVRAENKPASYVFKEIPGDLEKTHFYCFLNTDLKGWLPQFLIDQAMSGVLTQYLQHLKQYLLARRSSKQQTQGTNESSNSLS